LDVSTGARHGDATGITGGTRVRGAFDTTANGGLNRGDSDDAFNFNGTGPSTTQTWFQFNNRVDQGTANQVFAYEVWFKTNDASPNFGTIFATQEAVNKPANCNANLDRVLYMGTDGRLHFKFRPDKGSG
ncbi:MAG: hypothetical protein ACK5V3_11610, partial [Bdellovibrionales bacterium]